MANKIILGYTEQHRETVAGITRGNRGHILEFYVPDEGRQRIPAEVAVLAVDALVQRACDVRVLTCRECGEEFSANELYKYSDVPGDCPGCANDFFGCNLEGCPGDHHPEDECPSTI